VALHPSDRLPNLSDPPALEGELGRIDDGLLADLQRSQAEDPAGRKMAVRGGRDHHVPVVLLGVANEARQHLQRASRRPDRISRHDGGLVDDPIGEETLPVEEQRLVLAEREGVKRIPAVVPDDLRGAAVLIRRMAVLRDGGSQQRSEDYPAEHHGERDRGVDQQPRVGNGSREIRAVR
jgi:hypothetical protein